MPRAKSKPFLQSMAEYYADHPFIRVLVGIATMVLLAVVGVMLLSLVLASAANTLINTSTSLPGAGKLAEILVNKLAPAIASFGNAIAPQLVSALAHLPIIPAISAATALGILAAMALLVLYTVFTAHKAAEGASKQIQEDREAQQQEAPEAGRPMRKGHSNAPEPDISERARQVPDEEEGVVNRPRPGKSQE